MKKECVQNKELFVGSNPIHSQMDSCNPCLPLSQTCHLQKQTLFLLSLSLSSPAIQPPQQLPALSLSKQVTKKKSQLNPEPLLN